MQEPQTETMDQIYLLEPFAAKTCRKNIIQQADVQKWETISIITRAERQSTLFSQESYKQSICMTLTDLS